MKKTVFLFIFISYFTNAQVVLTHNIGNDLIGTSMYSCEQIEYWARDFVLEDFGITGDDEFTILSGQVGIHKAYYNATSAHFNIYKIDADFPNSFDESDLIGSSQVVTIPYVSNYSPPELLTIDFDTPVVIPADVDRILVEVKKGNLTGPTSIVVFLAGTLQDNDYSWYHGCAGNYPYATTEDISPPRPDARFYINVTGMVNLSIEDINALKKPQVYPNPTSGQIQISVPSNLSFEKALLYDINGKEINVSQFNFSMNLENLDAGIYFLKIFCDKMISTHKIIKM